MRGLILNTLEASQTHFRFYQTFHQLPNQNLFLKRSGLISKVGRRMIETLKKFGAKPFQVMPISLMASLFGE